MQEGDVGRGAGGPFCEKDRMTHVRGCARNLLILLLAVSLPDVSHDRCHAGCTCNVPGSAFTMFVTSGGNQASLIPFPACFTPSKDTQCVALAFGPSNKMIPVPPKNIPVRKTFVTVRHTRIPEPGLLRCGPFNHKPAPKHGDYDIFRVKLEAL